MLQTILFQFKYRTETLDISVFSSATVLPSHTFILFLTIYDQQDKALLNWKSPNYKLNIRERCQCRCLFYCISIWWKAVKINAQFKFRYHVAFHYTFSMKRLMTQIVPQQHVKVCTIMFVCVLHKKHARK